MRIWYFIVAGTLVCSTVQAEDTIAPVGDPSLVLYETRTDWTSKDGGKMNLSSFIFNDLNENGSWDFGDRVMPAVAVALAKNGVGVKISRSNANGFANFTSSTSKEDAVINEPAEYTFQVVPPPGWTVSTNNAEQIQEAIVVPGAPSGIVLKEMPRPVGLVRDKFIQGTYTGLEDGKISLTKTSGEKVLEGAISPGDTFTLKVPRGTYELNDGTNSRIVEVSDNPVDIGHLGDSDLPTGTEVIADFENLTNIGLMKVPNGYVGLEWYNLNAISRVFGSGNTGYVNGNTSGNYLVYTSSGHPAEITSDQPFNFISMQMTSAWGDAEGETANIELWRGNEKIQTDEVKLSVLGPIEYAPNISGITKVRISSSHYWQIAIDDIIFSHSDTAQ